MDCPVCGKKTKVNETRDTGDKVYRTRRCEPCDWLLTTLEVVIDDVIPHEAKKPRDWSAVNARRKKSKP